MRCACECSAVCCRCQFLYTVVLQETLSAKVLLGLDVVGGLGGYAVCYFTLPLDKRHLLPRDASLAKNLVVVAALLMVLSPVLMTLTRSYSDDTIWALSMLFVTMCLFSHDYTGRTDRPTTFSGTTSLNAAMFASVLLASRLPSTLHVFAVVALSIELFALFPIMRRCILVRSKRAYLSFTFGLFVLAGALLASLSTVVAYVFLLGVAFITLGAPMIMLVLQKHKRCVICAVPCWVRVAGCEVALCNDTGCGLAADPQLRADARLAWLAFNVRHTHREIQGPWDIAKPTVMADQR